MTASPISVTEEISLIEVMKVLDTNNLSHLLVNDSKGNLSGIISKHDILERIKILNRESSGVEYSALSMNSIVAKDVMTDFVLSVNESDSVEYAVELLLQGKFHCLPVINGPKAVGIITPYDLLKGYYQENG